MLDTLSNAVLECGSHIHDLGPSILTNMFSYRNFKLPKL